MEFRRTREMTKGRSGSRVLAFLLLTVAITASAQVAHGEVTVGQDDPVPIQGQEKWASVSDDAPAGMILDSSTQRQVTAGWLTFPEGRLPDEGKRAYVGVTVATIKVRPTKDVPRGIDYLWSKVGAWSYSSVSVKRTKKRDCPNAVTWNAFTLISGNQGGVDCDGTIRVKDVNVLTYGSVRPGTKRWSFTIESLGKHLIGSVKISRRSRVGITRSTPSNVKMTAPQTSALPDGEESSIPVVLTNHGARPARNMTVNSWVSRDDLPFGYQRVRRLPSLGPGKSRNVRVPVAAMPAGEYILHLAVGDNSSSDGVSYRYTVGNSVSQLGGLNVE